jgi:hypothetical protein
MCQQPTFNKEGAMRIVTLLVIPALVAALLAGCGGGGSDFGGSGSGSSGAGGNTITGPGANVAPISVNLGPASEAVNTGFVDVTVCAPGTNSCATISGIEVDTGSYGLRILASALPSGFALPQEDDANSNPIVECTIFADGISWGPVVTANIQISGESTSQSVPMQIIGSPSYTGVPAGCSSFGTPEDDLASFGANGIIGVGPFVQDTGEYFICPGGVCTQENITSDLEVSNPVAFFPADNNGVIVELPTVGASGADTLAGALVFGIGTESNNTLGSAGVYTIDPNTAYLSITYNGTTFPQSFVDSGSNANYFVDSTIPVCSNGTTAPGFFCPTSTLPETSTLTGTNGGSTTISFSVANAITLFNDNPNGIAFVNLAAPESVAQSFDFGLPFFYGRNVFTAINGASTPCGNVGPYVAF